MIYAHVVAERNIRTVTVGSKPAGHFTMKLSFCLRISSDGGRMHSFLNNWTGGMTTFVI